MRVLIAPDKFKGCLSAYEVAQYMKKGVLASGVTQDIVVCPMADGGEGTVETMVQSLGGEIIEIEVTGPLGERVKAKYGLIASRGVAVIEMAQASGLWLVPPEKRNPMETTTYGTGELILDALRRGATRIIVGIGGSATNDAGMGMAQALGYRFYDSDGSELGLGGKELTKISWIDCRGVNKLIGKAVFEVACDVKNPLYGENGAAHVYAPQKGATSEMVRELDLGLRNFARVVEKWLGSDVAMIPGAGAAGGLGAGMVAFLGATLRPGVELVADLVGLREKLKGVDLVLTGEGSLDAQSAMGKTPIGVARIAGEHGVPTIAFAGAIREEAYRLVGREVACIFSIVDGPMSLEESVRRAGGLLEKSVEQVMRAIGLAKSLGTVLPGSNFDQA